MADRTFKLKSIIILLTVYQVGFTGKVCQAEFARKGLSGKVLPGKIYQAKFTGKVYQAQFPGKVYLADFTRQGLSGRVYRQGLSGRVYGQGL